LPQRSEELTAQTSISTLSMSPFAGNCGHL
jgi:hypothetical protein